MFDSTQRAALLACSLALAACGSSGGGGETDNGGVFAGVNRTVESSTVVRITPTAPESAGVASFDWIQTAGPVVEFSVEPDGSVSLTAPSRDGVVELEVIGRGAGGGAVGRDRVIVEVLADRVELGSELLSNINVRGGGDGRARASALHGETERLFVIDSVAGDVLAYDVSSPGSPNFLGALQRPADVPGFTAGAPLSLACAATGPVAISWGGQTPEFPGVLQFIDPTNLQVQREVSTTGPNPVDVDASSDGRLFAVACAGDPTQVFGGDARGYVTLVRIPDGGPGDIEAHRDISPIVLSRFDGDEDDLAEQDVRFFNLVPVASIELTPRSVTISEDGQTVWASCPENDVLILIDPAGELVTDLMPLENRSFDGAAESFEARGARQVFSEAPAIATTAQGTDVPFGGISGIAGVELNSFGNFTLSVVSGAGPELGPLDRDGNGDDELTLVDPDGVQALRKVQGLVGAPSLPLELTETIELRDGAGEAVTGRPGLYGTQSGLAGYDEPMLDLDGQAVPTDALGARFGGATTTSSGDVWMGEMRRNGLWRFSASGRLLARYVPAGTPSSFGNGTLPEVFSQRRLNLELDPGERLGGFGAVAFHPVRNSIFAAVRLPLDQPDTTDDAASRASRIARIVEIDASSGAAIGEFAYVLGGVSHAIEGMVWRPGPDDEGLYLLEASTDSNGFRGVVSLDLSAATNLRNVSGSDYSAISAVLESTSPADLGGLSPAVTPIGKSLRADLRDLGLGGARPSALGLLHSSELIVAFDDGFQLGSASVSGGDVTGTSGQPASIARVSLLPSGIDATPSDGTLRFTPEPLEGLPQPLDILALEIDGEDVLFSADGGYARVLPAPTGGMPFDERLRVGGLLLDTSVFTNPAQLQGVEGAGNLLVSEIGSDQNGDALVDRLLVFGSRAVSQRSRSGDELWRSGQSLERRAFDERPGRVDTASELYGIRPSSLALGKLGSTDVLAVGLEGAGVVALFDLADPRAPLLSGVGSRALRPVDVDLASVGGQTLLVVTDEERGRIELRRITRQ